MIVETNTNDSYTKLEYKHLGTIRKQTIEIDDIISWLEAKNYKAGVYRYSRYQEYINGFQLTPVNDSDKKILLLSDLEEIYEKASKALLEIIQLRWVYASFKDVESKGFDERLKKVVSGPDFYIEKEQDPARDFLYELVVASWLEKKGYVLDFDSSDNTDVVGKRGDTEIFIECKRLKSSNKFENNYRKGCKQLKKVRGHNSAIKLVYIDIYNCISDKLKSYEYSNIFHVANAVKSVMKTEFIANNQCLIEKILKEYAPTVDGVVLTALGNYAVNSSSGIEIECDFDQKVILHSEISDERIGLIEDALR